MPVLLYHRIAELPREENPSGLAVPPAAFGAQMDFLRRRGFRFAPLSEMTGAGGSQGKAVAVTFDDGYLDCYTQAFPILKSFGIPAAVFLVTDFVGRTDGWEPGGAVPLMGRSHLREMAASGISFQSHTRTHPDLRMLPDDSVLRELAGSREAIRDMIGTPADHLAYPYGRFDARVRRLAEKAGFRWGWAAGMADDGLFSRERMQIVAGDGKAAFLLKSCRWASWIRKVRHP
jgi:peptidoglycan/xylan/chitin deacetylase (PgdA/CDA1 family)